MKAEELMIGDIVLFNDSPYIIEELSAKGWLHMTDTKYHLRVPMTSDYIFDYIEGAPITPEILEVNGFDKKWHDRSRCVIFDPKNDHVTSIVYNHHNATISIDDLPFNKVNKENQRNQKIEALGCRYVHELQHAMRLCGIDKEIVLNPEP